MDTLACAQVLWDYLCMNQPPKKADCIVGFGCYNEDIPRRAAQLYRDGFAPWVLFTGGLGRNTAQMWTESEAQRFGRIALSEGVPENALLLEMESTNTAENIAFTRNLLAQKGIAVSSILGVHKPYMERRIYAAWKNYWPQMPFSVTSYPQTMEEYLKANSARDRSERATIEMLVGDFQRMDLYAKKGLPNPSGYPRLRMGCLSFPCRSWLHRPACKVTEFPRICRNPRECFIFCARPGIHPGRPWQP